MILLTGATGHLGAAIVAELARRRDLPELRVWARSPEKWRRLQSACELLSFVDEKRLFIGDLRDEDAWARACRGVETIIHCAHSHEYWRGSAYLHEVNVGSARRLARAAAEHGVARVITIGSYSCFGKTCDPELEAELPRLAPRESSSKAKLVAGHVLAEGASSVGYTLDVVHPSYMIGPYQLDPTYFGALFHWVLFGPLRFCPPQGVNLIDVRDVARAVVDRLDASGPGEEVLATGDNTLFSELFKHMNRAAGFAVEPWTVPSGLLRRLPRLRLFGRFGQCYFDRPHYVDAAALKARRYDLETTIDDAIAWARQYPLFSGRPAILGWMARRYL